MKTKTTTMLTLACLPAFLAVGLAQPSETRDSRLPAGVIAHRDLAYVAGGHVRQKLDLYLPKAGAKLPLIINIHGGAFKMGSKEQGVPTEYLAEGYAVASIGAASPERVARSRAEAGRRAGDLLHGERRRARPLQRSESAGDDEGVLGETPKTGQVNSTYPFSMMLAA
jgi:hypothetical protein